MASSGMLLAMESAAATFAPDEEPTRRPNWRLSRRVMAIASGLLTLHVPSIATPWSNLGINPPAIPSIQWQQASSPASRADSAGSMAKIFVEEFAVFKAREQPASVPPVPYPDTNAAIVPGVCPKIS